MSLRIEDREAIRDIITVYTHAIDRQRWDLMERLFHEDALFGFGAVTGDWKEFVEQAKTVIGPCLATQHQLGQVLFGFESDTVCHTETYMTAMHTIPAGYTRTDVFPDKGKIYSAIIAGRYIDRFEKRDTADGPQWRLAKRQGLHDWREYREVEAVDLSDLPADACGSKGESDPASVAVKHWLGA